LIALAPAYEMDDETHKRAALVGALLLGHKAAASEPSG
jgi:hypothetical protein